MPQIVKKRRSGWAILAAGAMVASLLAVVASPAAAVTASSMADAASDRTACLGPATASADFEDVAMGGTHYENIQCLAYYGITTGREGGTQFAPNASVTRSQMSLFLSRLAAAAGVDLDDGSDAEFTDLAGIGADRVDAINRLVNAGIMTASGDDTFSPLAFVTRAEMALWLVSFMGNFSDDVSLDPDTGLYTIKVLDMVVAADGHDSFDDSLVSQPIHVHRAISVAFELGITTGYGDLEFKGHRHVSRQEMATFLMRTLAHTNLRPEGLTAQFSGTENLSIQVSMRAADFVPIDNEPIDVFGALFTEAAFNDDGECVTRYVARVSGATRVCEIDAGDFLTGTDGNSEFTATAESVRPEQDTISCGVGTYTVGSPIGDLANVEFWAWNGAYGDTVGEDTDLVKVVHVTPFSRTAGVEPDHASVTGGLDSMKNQLEAEMGDVVPYTVQLHGIGPEGVHVDTGPGDEDAEYNVVISKFAVAYEDVEVALDADDPDNLTEVRRRTERTEDQASPGLQAMKASAQPYVRTPMVLPVNSDGSLTIELTHGDPDRRKNNDDVIVEILVTPVEDNDLLIEEGLNYDSNGDGDVGAADDNGFFDSVVFSDDGVDQTRIVVSAATAPEYRTAPATGRSADGAVSVTVIDQYGKPVRGQGVHAVSDAGPDSNASPDQTLRFQDWYVTNSSGMHPIGYSYSGGIGIETLEIINTGTPRSTEPNADDVPEGAPFARLYWVVDGIQENSPEDGYGAIGDDAPAEGDWLVIDTARNTVVVFQVAVEDNVATSRNEGQDSGPHSYDWDERDTFTVGNSRVTMEQFEEVIGGGTEKNKVDVTTITWDDYDYYVYNDRANWTVTGSCDQDAPAVVQ